VTLLTNENIEPVVTIANNRGTKHGTEQLLGPPGRGIGIAPEATAVAVTPVANRVSRQPVPVALLNNAATLPTAWLPLEPRCP
jgi:hypothetical protein